MLMHAGAQPARRDLDKLLDSVLRFAGARRLVASELSLDDVVNIIWLRGLGG
jgi:hypothetical protein